MFDNRTLLFDFLTQATRLCPSVSNLAMKTPTYSPAKTEVFPEGLIRERITAWWGDEIDKRKNDPFAPKNWKSTLYEVLPAIDSLAVLESMIIIEQVLDQKIPSRVIRPGGYNSSDEMLKHLLPQLRKLHEKKSRP